MVPDGSHARGCACEQRRPRRGLDDGRRETPRIGSVCAGQGRALSILGTRDPGSREGTIDRILKAPAGCVVPWHSHTAEEQLIVIRGTVVAEMTNHPPTWLGPGGFAVMGGHMPHQFSCLGKITCMMFVTFDRPYDIRWGKT